MSLSKRSFLIGSVFFLFAFLTLPHYGINWDTINHLPRGQAFLRYFISGKKDYTGIEKYQPYWQNPASLLINSNIPFAEVPTRSFYQMEDATTNFYISIDGNGHPPLSDILSAAFNRIFFGRLRLVNDIDSYRVYGIFLAACLVSLLYYWISQTHGLVAALFSSLSLSLYPLFWAESHFNTEKDIPETVFWSFLLYSVWRGITTRSVKWLLLSGLFFGLALGTKFNVVFVAPIIGLWIIYLLIFRYLEFRQLPKIIICGLVAVVIGLSLFIASWPYLWVDPVAGIYRVLAFYENIGTGPVDSRFIGFWGIRTYPLLWISYTTPVVILFLSLVGLVFSKKNQHYFLFLLWLALPLIRVMWPGASFYGGVRQIMEYIPALAIFSGLGAKIIYDKLNQKALGFVVLLALFIPITIKLIQIHPNENVYFNPLIGGLAGAKKANLPYWGFSFGNPYRQGFEWINSHAEKGAEVVFVHELMPNSPPLWVRPDILFYNHGRSGYLRHGEYAITLTYQGIENRSYYEMYLNKFIEPVYQVKVDGVAILKIWKNDDAHLKVRWDEQMAPKVKLTVSKSALLFDLGEVRKLSRLVLQYNQDNCKLLTDGYFKISQDNKNWQRLPGNLPDDWRVAVLGEQPKDGKFVEPFLGQVARYIELIVSPSDTCLKNVKDFSLYYFK